MNLIQQHLLRVPVQVEAVPPPQFDQPLHEPSGLCRQAAGLRLLLQTQTTTLTSCFQSEPGLGAGLTSRATIRR